MDVLRSVWVVLVVVGVMMVVVMVVMVVVIMVVRGGYDGKISKHNGKIKRNDI